MSYKEYKCKKCGWVHAAIPLADAVAQVASANEYEASTGRPQAATLAHYLRCFRCGASTTDFVPAEPGDAPSGSTIQGVVVPGLWELSKADEEQRILAELRETVRGLHATGVMSTAELDKVLSNKEPKK